MRVSKRVTMLVWVSVVVSLGGCKRGPQPFADTLGRTFTYECNDESGCTFTREGVPSNAKKEGVLLARTGRILSVCDVPHGVKEAPRPECRAVTCQTNGCPPDPSGRRLSCETGLCVAPDAEITTDDAVLLCLADTDVGRSAQSSARLALAYSCGKPCKVPASCRQP